MLKFTNLLISKNKHKNITNPGQLLIFSKNMSCSIQIPFKIYIRKSCRDSFKFHFKQSIMQSMTAFDYSLYFYLFFVLHSFSVLQFFVNLDFYAFDTFGIAAVAICFFLLLLLPLFCIFSLFLCIFELH